MNISEFAGATGVSADTLRYYEKLGLLQPQRNSAGWRAYSEQDKEWLTFILLLKETDMPLSDIKRYAVWRKQGDQSFADRMELLIAHQARLLERQQQLDVFQQRLTDKIKRYQKLLAPS